MAGRTCGKCRVRARNTEYAWEAASAAGSDVALGAGAPDSRPFRMGRHGVSDTSIGLETAPTLFGARWSEPKNRTGPQMTIRAAIGGAGGDALMQGT
jgi:hypothetical protein